MAHWNTFPVVALTFTMACAVGPHRPDVDNELAPDAGTPNEADRPDSAPPPPPAPPAPTPVYAHSRDSLFLIDTDDFALQTIGDFGIDENITDLAVTPDGRLFGISGSSLYSVDRTNGAATFIADVPGVLNVGLTFLPSGQLLATDKEGGVREVNPNTGAISEVGKFGNGWGTAGDLVAVADGTMFAIGQHEDSVIGDPNSLLTVDTSTGDAVWVGEIGYDTVYGTAFANGKVYAFTEDGKIIEIDPATGAGTLVLNHTEEFWGAAVTPLIPVE